MKTHDTDSREHSVDELELTVRTANALEHAGIKTIGGLCAKTQRDLLGLRGFGRKQLVEVRSLLEARGLTLAGETLPPPHRTAADDGMVALIERRWPEGLARSERAVRMAFDLQHVSQELNGAIRDLQDLARLWRSRALDAEQALRDQSAELDRARRAVASAARLARDCAETDAYTDTEYSKKRLEEVLAVFHGLAGAGQIDLAADTLYVEVNCLYHAHQFELVDESLPRFELEKLDTNLLVALLSITALATDKLPGRPALVERVEARLRMLAPARIEGLMQGLR